MKKYLFGILFITVVLAGTSFAQDRQANFSVSKPTTTESPNLIGHWALDGNAIDSSGNENNGSVVGNVTVSSSGKYYNFDGDGDYIDLGVDITPKTKYTKSVWLKTSTVAALNLYSGSQNEVLYLNDGQILLSNTWHDNSKNVYANATYHDNEWHNIVAVYNGTDGLIYMDGVLLNSGPMDDIPVDTRSYLGHFSSGFYYTGSMAEVKLYDGVLSDEEILSIYEARGDFFDPPSSGPVCGDETCDVGENNANCPADCPVVAAGAHYVDNAVSSSGDGSSWSNAWKSFASINWSQINPGDVIYISGGASGKTYNEMMVVGASGDSSNQITITKGVDAGHNGQAVIDGTGFGTSKGIYMSHTSAGGACDGYITVSNLYFRNWGYCAIGGYGDGWQAHNEATAIKGVIVENNNVRVAGRVGVIFTNSSNCIVRNNYIDTPDWVDAQTDGIFSGVNSFNSYENNTIIINNSEPTGHDDCIQMLGDADTTISGNYLEQNNNKVSNAQGIMAEGLLGVIKIYDNVVKLKSASSAFNFIGTGNDTIEFIGNTVTNTSIANYLYILRDCNNPIIKNNIGVMAGGNGKPLTTSTYHLSSVVVDPARISNNSFWNSGTANVATIYGMGSMTQTELEARGINLGGLNQNPQFRNPENGDFTPLNSNVCTASDTGSYVGALPCN